MSGSGRWGTLALVCCAALELCASDQQRGPERGGVDVRTSRNPASGPATESAAAEVSGFERYRVLVQRNIFLKDRSRARSDARTERREERAAPPAPPPPPPELSLVLVGVVQIDGVPGAVLENRSTGRTQTVRVGEELGGVTIAAITLDGLEVAREGNRTPVKMGSTLGGGVPVSTATTTVTVPASGSAAAPAAAPGTGTATTDSSSTGTAGTPGASSGGGGAESVLERMRRRRLEEMKK